MSLNYLSTRTAKLSSILRQPSMPQSSFLMSPLLVNSHYGTSLSISRSLSPQTHPHTCISHKHHKVTGLSGYSTSHVHSQIPPEGFWKSYYALTWEIAGFVCAHFSPHTLCLCWVFLNFISPYFSIDIIPLLLLLLHRTQFSYFHTFFFFNLASPWFYLASHLSPIHFVSFWPQRLPSLWTGWV